MLRARYRIGAGVIALSAGLLAPLSAADAAEKPAEKKRQPIYNQKADAKAEIARALARAETENRRVLLVFGGNWCGWCYKLHDLFTDDRSIRGVLLSDYEVVWVDIGSNRDLATKYKIERDKGVPYLTVLDADSKVVKNQNTGDLEKGAKHDPAKVLAFLKQWTPPPRDAGTALKEALARARRDRKMVFVRLGSPGCVWCRRLEEFLHRKQTAEVIGRDFIALKIDLVRMKNGERVGRQLRGGTGGIPWFAFLDAEGKKLQTSDGPAGNVGFPVTDQEIAHFKTMLSKAARNITAEQIGAIVGALKDDAKKSKRRP